MFVFSSLTHCFVNPHLFSLQILGYVSTSFFIFRQLSSCPYSGQKFKYISLFFWKIFWFQSDFMQSTSELKCWRSDPGCMFTTKSWEKAGLCTVSFYIVFELEKFLTPAKERHTYNMMLPSPCFTERMTCSGWRSLLFII